MKSRIMVRVTPYDSVAMPVNIGWQKAYAIVKRAFEAGAFPDVTIEENNNDGILITINWSRYDWPTLVEKFKKRR